MIWHSHKELFCKSILRVGLKPVRQKLVNVLIQSNYYIWIGFVSNILLDFYLLAFKNSRAKKNNYATSGGFTEYNCELNQKWLLLIGKIAFRKLVMFIRVHSCDATPCLPRNTGYGLHEYTRTVYLNI